MSSILTNNSSMVALETLRNINRNLESVQSEISTGKKVSSAKDNASVWAISTVMSTDVDSFQKISESLDKGTSTVGVARAGSEQITGLLQEMKNLIVSAQEDLNADDRKTIQDDIAAKRTTITNIVNAAQFNGQNLLKGTDAISVLASLDRGADGKVSATKISVARNDLQTTAAIPEAAKATTDAGYVSTTSTATVSDKAKANTDGGYLSVAGLTSDKTSAGGDATVTIKAGNITVGDKFTINIGGSDFSYTSVAGDTINDVATNLAGLVTTADSSSAITNLNTVTVTPGADPTANDAKIVFSADSGQQLDATEAKFTSTYSDSSIADGDTASVTIKGGTLSAGDKFTVNAGGSDFTYTAVEGDTNNDVAAGLKTLIDAGSITNLTVAVTDATDPAAGAATLKLTAGGGDVKANLGALASTNVAVAAGGLGAIAGLSVSTSAEATTALSTIEDLLSTSIKAATSFGSSQQQIQDQGDFIEALSNSLTSGIGTLVDADIESASAKLQALQVQQQLGVQALSIANSAPQTLLSLFR